MASAAVTRELPPEVLEQLRILDLELEEGDITQKGYEKKKSNLLQALGLSDSTQNDHEPPAENGTINVPKEDDSIRNHDTLPTDMEPEPSAADVVDFLDYLPSPTHSPKQPEHGAALMEENHQRLQVAASSSATAEPVSLQQQPPSPAFQHQGLSTPVGPRPLGPSSSLYMATSTMTSPRPSWAYDPRMARPAYQQATYPPATARPPYSAYPVQPRPPMGLPPYNRPPPPPPPPTNMPPYGSRPMYPPQQRPMYPHQQLSGAPRPGYPPATGMMPARPMPPFGSPRPMNNTAPFTPPTVPHIIHNRTSSLESGSEANTMIQNQSMDTQPQMSGHADDWETGSVSGNWRLPSGRAPSIVSTTSHSKQPPMRSSGSHYALMDVTRNQISRRSSLTLGRSKYGNSYMATSFKAIEPAPQPRLLLDDPTEQMLIADMAGRQLLPLEAREIPFELLDASDHNNLSKFSNLAEILRHRATRSGHARLPAFTVVDGRGKEATSYTWEKLNARAEKVAHLIREKSGLHFGDRVALIYRKSEQLDFIVALLGCFLAGMVAVPINAAEEVSELSFILNLTNAYLVLTTEFNLRAFTKDMQARSIEFPPNIDWWKTDDFGSWYPRSKSGTYPAIKVPELAYVEYAKAANGELKGVAVNHKTIMSECAAIMGAMTETVESKDGDGAPALAPKYNARGVDCMVTYLEHRQQVGLVLSILWSIFAGSHTIFASSSIIDTPAVWIYVLSKYKATIALADYQSMKHVTQYYQAHTKEVQNQSKKVSPDLSALQYLMIDTIVIRPELNEFIANFLLKPLNNKSPLETVCPIASLPEHGGTIISFRDNLGSIVTEAAADDPQGASMHVDRNSSREIWEYVLDADSLKMNKVVVLAAGNDACDLQNTNEPGRVRVAAFGFAMPEANVAIVDPETCMLCPPDTIGEIWIDAPSISGGFWALPKHTEAIFHARPIVVPAETLRPEIYNQEFLRTGLVGTLIGGRVVIFGTYEDRIRQQRLGESFGVEEVHFADHLVATIQKQARIEQCCVFDIPANDQHLPIVVCESGIPRSELPGLSSNISELLQSYHGLRVYAVVVLAPNGLLRQSKHGRRQIHALMVKRAFLAGQLSMRYLKMDVDRTVFDLATNEDPVNGIWRSAMAYEKAISLGLIIPRLQQQHTGMESVREVIDERTDFDLTKFGNIIEILLWRTRLYPEETAFVSVTQATSSQSMNTKPYSWRKINNKIAAVANFLMKKGFKRGRKALVLVPFGVEWIQAIYACFVLGVIPVPFEPTNPQQHPQRAKEDILALAATIRDLDISYIIINSQSDDIMKNKHVVAAVKHMLTIYRGSGFKLPDYTNISKAPSTKKMLGKESGLYIKPEWASTGENLPALITVHRSADGDRFYSSLGHETLLAQCRTQKMTCQMKSQRSIVGVGLGAYDGLGLLHYGFCGVYIGSPTIMLSVDDFYVYPTGFFELLQRYKAKDVCASHLLLQYAMNRTNPADQRSIALQTVQNLMLVTDSRPKPVLYQSMLKHFGRNHLEKEAINTVYSHIANPMITTRSYMLIEPISLLVDTFWLRKGVVRPLPMEEEAHGLLLHDSGIVPSNTMVAIVNPETGVICPSNTVGEVWVASDCNVKTLVGLSESAHVSKFEATITGGDPRVKYMRTGDLGFLWNVQRRVDHGQPLIEEGQCLFVLGSMNEAIYRNGLLHFALDIELTVERCHPGIAAGGCIVFQAEQEIVAVAAVKSKEQALSAVPLIVTAILENHSFLVDTVAIVHSNQLPRSRYGDKQRGKAKAAFMEKTLPVIYVSRINNQHEPLTLPKWGQSQLGADNDVGSVISLHTTAQHSTGVPSIADNTEFERSDGAVSQLGRRDTMSSRQSPVPDSPAVTHISYSEEARNI